MKTPPDSIKVLIADDHLIVRMGLATLFENTPGFTIAGEAEDGEDAVRKAIRLRPDVVVMDISMPGKDGIQATREIRAAAPEVKILALTTFATSDAISDILAAGAKGVLFKNASRRQMLDAIRCVVRGERILTDDAREMLQEDPPVEALSPRQREILDLIVRGISNREIARLLGISVTVVKEHITSLYAKLGAANRAEAVAIALRRRLLKA